jgi:hypothetical protein
MGTGAPAERRSSTERRIAEPSVLESRFESGARIAGTR